MWSGGCLRVEWVVLRPYVNGHRRMDVELRPLHALEVTDYSTLAADALTSAAHFGASSAMKAAKSCGDPALASALNLAKFVLISADCRLLLMARLSLPTTAAAVPAGASTPVQEAGGNPP